MCRLLVLYALWPSACELADLVTHIASQSRVHPRCHPGAEISMEADPGTFDAARLREYMDTGLTRFSVGVQAFQEAGAHLGGLPSALVVQKTSRISDLHLHLRPCALQWPCHAHDRGGGARHWDRKTNWNTSLNMVPFTDHMHR